MEYHKNLILEDLFYINDDGLVCCEEWRDVIGYKGIYMISDLGRFKSFQLNTIKIIKGWRDTYGYRTITLRENKVLKPRTIHRIVAESFLNHKPNGTNEIVVDHKNHIKTDDRLENIQLVTNRINSSKDRYNGSSNFIGVTYNKKSKKWRSQITINKKRIGLGYFTNEIDASNAYQNKLKIINQ